MQIFPVFPCLTGNSPGQRTTRDAARIRTRMLSGLAPGSRYGTGMGPNTAHVSGAWPPIACSETNVRGGWRWAQSAVNSSLQKAPAGSSGCPGLGGIWRDGERPLRGPRHCPVFAVRAAPISVALVPPDAATWGRECPFQMDQAVSWTPYAGTRSSLSANRSCSLSRSYWF